jgi:threonine dehydratase
VTRIPDFDDVRAAAKRIAGHARRTPLLANTPLDVLTGGRLLARDAAAYGLVQVPAPEPARTVELGRAPSVWSRSRREPRQGVAEAARRFGMRATIVMPSDAPALVAQYASHGCRSRGIPRAESRGSCSAWGRPPEYVDRPDGSQPGHGRPEMRAS